jgi:hypothetical protein
MMNLGMNFVSAPEGAFTEDCNPNLDVGQTLALFNQTKNSNNTVTMANPQNVRDLYEMIS